MGLSTLNLHERKLLNKMWEHCLVTFYMFMFLKIIIN